MSSDLPPDMKEYVPAVEQAAMITLRAGNHMLAENLLREVLEVVLERQKLDNNRIIKLIFAKLQDFEEKQGLNMKFHVSIKEADAQLKKCSETLYRLSRLIVWECLGFIVLLVLWILRIIMFCK